MRVGIDVSPLRQTRAGTARYLLGLLPHLERSVDVERLAWGGAGKLATVVRDAWWYPVDLPRRARGLDVLHCPSFRAPVKTRTPLVVSTGSTRSSDTKDRGSDDIGLSFPVIWRTTCSAFSWLAE